MILHLGHFTRRGLMVGTGCAQQIPGGDKAREEQRVQDQKGGVEYRETTDLSVTVKL